MHFLKQIPLIILFVGYPYYLGGGWNLLAAAVGIIAPSLWMHAQHPPHFLRLPAEQKMAVVRKIKATYPTMNTVAESCLAAGLINLVLGVIRYIFAF